MSFLTSPSKIQRNLSSEFNAEASQALNELQKQEAELRALLNNSSHAWLSLDPAYFQAGLNKQIWVDIVKDLIPTNYVEVAKQLISLGEPVLVKPHAASINSKLESTVADDAVRETLVESIIARLVFLKHKVEAAKTTPVVPATTKFSAPPEIIKSDYPNGFARFEAHCRREGVPLAEWPKQLARALKNPMDAEKATALWVQAEQEKTPQTWNQYKCSLLKLIFNDAELNQLSMLAQGLKPSPGETKFDYHQRFKAVVTCLNKTDSSCLFMFNNSLPDADRTLNERMLGLMNPPPTFIKFLDDLDAASNSATTVYVPVVPTPTPITTPIVSIPPPPAVTAVRTTPASNVQAVPTVTPPKTFSSKRAMKTGSRVHKRTSDGLPCTYCGKPGHVEDDCWGKHPEKKKNKKPHSSYSMIPSSAFTGIDFLVHECNLNSVFMQQAWIQAIIGPVAYSSELFYKQFTLQNRLTIEGLLDTGSHNCTIEESLLKRLERTGHIKRCSSMLKVTFANQQDQYCDVVMLQISADGYSKLHPFVVLPKATSPLIIGIDLIKEWHLLYEMSETAEYIHEQLQKHRMTDVDFILDEPQDIVLHSNQERLLLIIQPHIDANLATESTHSTIGEISIDFHDDGDDGNGPSRTKGVWRDQMPLSITALEFYEDEVEKWKKANIIEEIFDIRSHHEKGKKGSFNTNGFAIMSGKLRIVHNFKPINDLIRDDTRSIPGIDVAFEAISRSKPVIYSKIDLKSAYLQIPLKERDRSITAFSCGNKRYRFITAPLGLKTIPSQFHRWIKGLLQLHGCSLYTVNHLDDIIVFSSSVEEHITHVQQVLNALTSVSLTIQKSKCIFFATTLPVLGFVLQTNGIRPNTKKIFNMPEWQRPNTRKRVQSLVGILNFFRRFVNNFSERVYPIMNIKQRRFNWAEQQGAEDAYQDLYKALMSSNAFLYFPDMHVPLELATDASATTIGATLFQRIAGEVRILGFNSRVLKDTEMRYSIPKKELISVLYHIKHYHHLLYGRKFHLYTDSESVASILQALDSPKKNTILAGWIAELAQYSFVAHHIRGEDNTMADMASRVQTMVIDEILSKSEPQSQFIQYGTIEPLLTSNEEQLLFQHVHSIGHWGSVLMYKHIVNTLGITNIENLLKKCSEFTKQCPACLRVNKHTVKFAPPRVPSIWLPMEYVSTDLLELDESKNGYKYVLVLLDLMSNFVQLKALKSKEMQEVVEELRHMFCNFGFPSRIKSDNGSEFVNKLMQELTTKVRIKHHRVIAYDHHANGEVERAIRSVRDTVLKLAKDDEPYFYDKWDELIPIAQFALNNKVHPISNLTPFELVFGRTAFQSESLRLLSLEQSQEAMSEFWSTFHREIPKSIRDMKLRFQENRKYPRKTVTFEIGDNVMHMLQKSSKQDDNYTGPYKVIDSLDHGHYLLESPAGIRIEAPANFLKIASVNVKAEALVPFDPFEQKVASNSSAAEDSSSDLLRIKGPKAKKQKVTVATSKETNKNYASQEQQNRKAKSKPIGYYAQLAGEN